MRLQLFIHRLICSKLGEKYGVFDMHPSACGRCYDVTLRGQAAGTLRTVLVHGFCGRFCSGCYANSAGILRWILRIFRRGFRQQEGDGMTY